MKNRLPPVEPSFLRFGAGRTPAGSGKSETNDVAPLSPVPASSRAFFWQGGGKSRPLIRVGFVTGLVLVAFISLLTYRNTCRLLEVEAQIARSYSQHSKNNGSQTAPSDLHELRNQQALAQELRSETLLVTGLGGAVALLVVLSAFLVVEKELTRRSRTEAELREREAETNRLLHQLTESEERFRIVADTAPVMLYATDESGSMTYLSRLWLEFRGRTEAEELGSGWLESLPEKDREAVVEKARDTRTRRVPNRLEFRARRHDGALRWLLASSVPRYLDGRYAGHIGSALDITEIKQAEDEMRVLIERQQKSETRLRQVSRQANCLLWEATVSETSISQGSIGEGKPEGHNPENHTALIWNLSVLDEDGAHQWLPIEWEPGQTFAVAFNIARSADDRAASDATSITAIREGKTGYRNEFRVRLADGSDCWIAEDVRIEPITTSGGTIENATPVLGKWRLVGVCTDINDRKKQEENLTRITMELQRSNEALQDFASIASHDLREPLRKIQMFGGMLQKNVAQIGDQNADRNLGRVLAAASRMEDLVRDLLAYSQVTSKAAPPATVDLSKIVGDVVIDLEARILETGGSVGVDKLPRLQADAVQMRQLFQNLISNALKFHKPDDLPVVLVRGKREMMDGVLTVVISISDNGVGFDPEYAERVFNIFERLDSEREGYEGTGVGLAICKKIAQRHGGTISAESQPGFGSTFTVRLPAAPESGGAEKT